MQYRVLGPLQVLDGQPVPLGGYRQRLVLAVLLSRPNQVLGTDWLVDAVWGAEPDVYSNVVDLYVHYLRRKLERLGRRESLRTIRGVGYSLRTESSS